MLDVGGELKATYFDMGDTATKVLSSFTDSEYFIAHY